MHARALSRFSSIAALLLTLTASTPLAYPITPVTLWDLVQEADLVLLADVAEVTEAVETAGTDLRGAPSASRMGGPGSIARLRIRETWKGLADGTVEVAFDPNYICPAPPRYVAGKTVVAFLTRDGDRLSTLALSYGTHYPSPADIPVYRDRVREARDLQSRRNVSDADRLDWLVRAASRRATRWDALYELAPKGDSLHSSYDGKVAERAGSERLTPAQYQALALGFAGEPSADRTLVMILSLFDGRPHHALDRAAMGAVERVLLADDAPWWIGEALGLLLPRVGDPAPQTRLAPLGDTWDDKEIKTVRAIWAQAKAELGLEDVAPAESTTVEVWGVGSNTPD